MHRLQSRALGIALGGTAFGGLIVGLTGAVSASAATLNDGGYTSGWVYTSTNATSGNQVDVFSRQANGTLTSAGTYNTTGTGTGAGGFSQGAVTLSPDHLPSGKGRWRGRARYHALAVRMLG